MPAPLYYGLMWSIVLLGVNSCTHYPIAWGNINLGVNSEDGIEAYKAVVR